jgi:hypothetical protein
MTVRNQAGKHMRNQFGAQIRNQKGLATWVKVLIGVMVIGTISIVGIIGAGVYFIGSSVKDLQDPAKIKATINSIAQFQDPLPAGWKFGMGLNVFGMTSVAQITNEKAKLNIMLLKLPRGGKDATSEVVLNEYAEKGIPNVSGASSDTSSAPLSIKDKGKFTVAGEEVNFVSGESERGSEKFSQFIGMVAPKSNSSTILIQGTCLGSDSYNLEETKKLLSAIKSF